VHHGNAKYWFRRVGAHPIFEALRARATDLAGTETLQPSARFLTRQQLWDPFAFVDLCTDCMSRRSPHEALCRQIQQHEWSLLFEHCYRAAVAPEA
jgi:hypothetical protein